MKNSRFAHFGWAQERASWGSGLGILPDVAGVDWGLGGQKWPGPPKNRGIMRKFRGRWTPVQKFRSQLDRVLPLCGLKFGVKRGCFGPFYIYITALL